MFSFLGLLIQWHGCTCVCIVSGDICLGWQNVLSVFVCCNVTSKPHITFQFTKATPLDMYMKLLIHVHTYNLTSQNV